MVLEEDWSGGGVFFYLHQNILSTHLTPLLIFTYPISSPPFKSYFYQIENLGDDDDGQIEYSSADIPATSLITFTPRPLRNLSPVDELSSLSPLIEAKLSNLAGEETPQIYSLCGKGARSSFRVLRHGIEVSEVAVSELPGNPSAVWTVKTNVRGEV